jgi:hypothetical protein
MTAIPSSALPNISDSSLSNGTVNLNELLRQVFTEDIKQRSRITELEAENLKQKQRIAELEMQCSSNPAPSPEYLNLKQQLAELIPQHQEMKQLLDSLIKHHIEQNTELNRAHEILSKMTLPAVPEAAAENSSTTAGEPKKAELCTGCDTCNPKKIPITNLRNCLMCGHVYQPRDPNGSTLPITAKCGCKGFGWDCTGSSPQGIARMNDVVAAGCQLAPELNNCFKCSNK